MRVLIYGFTGNVLGGIEVYTLNMSEYMSDDCVFDYIVDGDECAYRERITKRGGKIFFVPWVRRHPLGYINKLWRIFGEEKKSGTNILYHQLFTMSNLIPDVIAKLRGYKVILHAHNNGLQKGGRMYLMAHNLGKILSRFCGFVMFTNSQLSSDYMFGKGVNSKLIYNAIDVGKFAFKQEHRDCIRKELDCQSKTVIGFVGRLVDQKNPLFMLKVFAEIHKLRPNSELWIIGEGILRGKMEVEINEQGICSSVKWLGRREDVNRLMQGMDLLLQPSVFEGLGIVLVEAQATGLAVVSSEVVIPKEAVISDRIKLLPLSEKSAYWAAESVNLLDSCCESYDRTNAMVPDCYNIQHEAKRLESMLKELIS